MARVDSCRAQTQWCNEATSADLPLAKASCSSSTEKYRLLDPGFFCTRSNVPRRAIGLFIPGSRRVAEGLDRPSGRHARGQFPNRLFPAPAPSDRDRVSACFRWKTKFLGFSRTKHMGGNPPVWRCRAFGISETPLC